MLNAGNREVTVKHVLGALLGAVTLLGSAPSIAQTTLTIATVNNGDMIRMQALTSDFTAKNPDVTVKWVTLEENVLRQRVTTDIATKGGQFDVLTIGTYEVPIWAKRIGWYRSTISDRTMTRRICFRRSAMPCRCRASSMPRRSTGRVR